jgi:hypothetical protein
MLVSSAIAVETSREKISYPQLPLAVYREIAAHLGQIEGVITLLIAQSSTHFDYAQSQVEALEIHYPQNLPAQEKVYLEKILSYYAQLYGDYKRVTV